MTYSQTHADLTSIKGGEIMPALSLLHEGKLKEARAALAGLETFEAVVLLAHVDHAEGLYEEAIKRLSAVRPEGEPQIVAKYHIVLGSAYLDGAEDSLWLDRALVEFEGARYYAELAARPDFVGHVENNIARVLAALGRYAEAHGHLATARTLFTDPVKLAEIDDTEGQVCLRERNYTQARSLLLRACHVFDREGEARLLGESLRYLNQAMAHCGGL